MTISNYAKKKKIVQKKSLLRSDVLVMFPHLLGVDLVIELQYKQDSLLDKVESEGIFVGVATYTADPR